VVLVEHLRLEAGEPGAGGDSGEALDLPPSRLTLTFGFGAGLFAKDGRDRYGLARHRPEALIDLPLATLAPGEYLLEVKATGQDGEATALVVFRVM